jgi:hypothetical protein
VVVVVVEASVVAAPSVVAGAAVAAPVVSAVTAVAVVSVVASTVLVSVAVVVSAVLFSPQEARVAAKTTARADTFRRFFILVVGLENLVRKTPFIPSMTIGNPTVENIFSLGYQAGSHVLISKANG